MGTVKRKKKIKKPNKKLSSWAGTVPFSLSLEKCNKDGLAQKLLVLQVNIYSAMVLLLLRGLNVRRNVYDPTSFSDQFYFPERKPKHKTILR